MSRNVRSATAAGRAWAALAVMLLALPAYAVQPDEILEDAALEARARALSAHLRCLVCQNQSIDDSNAPLARDLRLLVRERLLANDSDEAVLDYIVQRYGEFVLLKPPFKPSTLLLWLSPLAFLFGAVWLARRALSERGSEAAAEAAAPLSPEERLRLDRLLKPGGDSQ